MSPRPAHLGPLVMRAIAYAWRHDTGAWLEVLSCGHLGCLTGPGGSEAGKRRRHCARCAEAASPSIVDLEVRGRLAAARSQQR